MKPAKVTLWGKRVFADVIKIRILRRRGYTGLTREGASKSKHISLSVRRKGIWATQKGKQWGGLKGGCCHPKQINASSHLKRQLRDPEEAWSAPPYFSLLEPMLNFWSPKEDFSIIWSHLVCVFVFCFFCHINHRNKHHSIPKTPKVVKFTNGLLDAESNSCCTQVPHTVWHSWLLPTFYFLGGIMVSFICYILYARI